MLNTAGFATLLVDLLTPDEKQADRRTRELRFDVEYLGERVTGIVDWLAEYMETRGLQIGGFGSHTGAAGMLIAATKRPQLLKAVVSRGGRVDMVQDVLGKVRAPVLCIVGERDMQILSLNRWALEQMKTRKELAIVPAAGPLFEEPGALDHVAQLARQWFSDYLE